MKKLFWLIVILMAGAAVAFWLFVRRDNNMYRLVPKDAQVVLSLSIPALLQEISMEELQKIDFFEKFKSDLKMDKDTVVWSRINALRNEGSNFGVDVLSDVVLFKSKYEGLDFLGLVFDISDPSEFRKLLNAIDPGYIIDMKANYSVMDLSEGIFLAWNKRGGIIVRNEYNYAYAKKVIRDNFIVETFSRSEEQSIIALPAFSENRKPEYLVQAFVNYEALDTAKVRKYDDGEYLVKPESSFGFDLFKNSFFSGGLKHQNQTLILDGKIESFTNGQVPFNQYTATGLSDGHLKSIAASDPLVVLGLAARNGHDLDSLMVDDDIKEGWQEILDRMGWSHEEGRSIYGSELSVALHGVKKVPFDSQTDVAPWDRSQMGMQDGGDMFTNEWTFSGQLVNSNKELLRRSLDSLASGKSMLKARDNAWECTFGSYRMFVVETPMGLCITNDQNALDAYRNGNAGHISDRLMNGLLANQLFMYANLDESTYDEATRTQWINLQGENAGNIFMQQFKDIEVNYRDGHMELRLQLVNGEEKLLNRVLKILNEIKNPAVS